MQTPVPACPAWRVHDLLCHLVGLPGDVNAGGSKARAPTRGPQLRSPRTATHSRRAARGVGAEAQAFEEIIPMIDPPRPSSTSSCTSKTCAARSGCLGRVTARACAGSSTSRWPPRVRDRRSEPSALEIAMEDEGFVAGSGDVVDRWDIERFELFRSSRVAAAPIRSGRRAARSSTCEGRIPPDGPSDVIELV